MFKKNCAVVNDRVLSGKDVKKLRADVAAACRLLSEAAVDDLVPPKATVSLQKLQNRATVYSLGEGGEPLFFEVHGQLLPTVYALWRYPHALPMLTTYSEVSPKVLGGADLFLAGVIVPEQGLPTFDEGQPMAVTVLGHPLPFAVGVMECSSAEAKKSGMKGRGLKLLHTYTDLLWGMGPKSAPHPSFTPERVFQYDSAERTTATASPADDAAPADTGPAGAAGRGVQSLSIADSPAARQSNATGAAPAKPPAEAGREAATGAVAAVDINDPDALFLHCLVAGLHSLGDDLLPIMTSDFYSKHMQAAKPEGSVLDIKKTSWKKLSKLLSVHEKKALLSQKPVHKQDHIVAVNRGHKLYTEFAPSEQPTAAAQPAVGPSGKTNTSLATITVTTAYRVPSSLAPVFGGAQRDALHSGEEVEVALQRYAAEQGLAAGPDAAELKLDRLLIEALYNKTERPAEGSAAPFEATLQRLLKKLQLWSRITRTTQQEEMETLKKGAPQPLSITLEDRHGGRKHLTKISGMEQFGIDAEELSSALQKRFQGGASVAKLPGKTETGKEVSLQGDQLHSAEDFISATYGLPPAYISAKSKSKG